MSTLNRHVIVFPQWVARRLLPPLINCGMIALGSLIFIAVINAVMVPHRIFGGGLSGIVLLLKFHFHNLDIGLTYLLLNIPLVALGWFCIGHRFIYYTLFGIGFFSLAAARVHVPVPEISDPMLASLFAGLVCGIGGGVVLRSLGSLGGLDILAVLLNERLGFRLGTISFTVNAGIIITGAYFLGIQTALYSLVYLFTCGRAVDLVVTGFSIRKSVMVISSLPEALAKLIITRIGSGVTYLDGQGAFSGAGKRVLLTVISPTDLPRLKELVLAHDPGAFVVINDTSEVLGRGHGALREY